MRPKSILFFEILFLSTLAIGVLQSWLAWEELLQSASIGFVLFIQVGTFLLLSGLVLLTSRRRSKIAMWIVILMTLLGLPLLFEIFSSGMLLGSVWITLVRTFGQLIAITLLFLPSSRKWLANEEDVTNLTKTFS